MTILDRLASSRGRRDEAPNQELAKDLVLRGDEAGIREVAKNLWNKVAELMKEEVKKGILDAETKIPSSVTSHGAGFVVKENEI